MLPPSDRYVLLGIPDSTPSPGIYSSMQWRKGGFTAPLFPLPIQCTMAEQAQMLYNQLQPWLNENAHEFSERPDGIHWAFFHHQEALSSVNASMNSSFKLAFTFNLFEEAVHALFTNTRIPPGAVYTYDPTNNRDLAAKICATILPPAASPYTTTSTCYPKLSTGRWNTYNPKLSTGRRNTSNAPNALNAAITGWRHLREPVALIYANATPTQAMINWVQYYLTSHNFSPDDTEEIENELEGSEDRESFVYAVNCRGRLLSARVARSVWDLQALS
ncbi:hypothetical protein K435DRAFT_870722 [Dendrothele bispora CBS 962.96]|uniref:Uncharacterized protein n=1 Tax=Dendrothele bispora (strain CBS 962.96) TaxID=1314807 RepID=A0A4S8KU87_DENBC|nr:hypothetical protein K435DRAFT_875648 [Dendrothele bispora CBS 962.96]THU84016.1 hypothetical protein K435DRAFT_870722 [Dendrothele bispora CBS 962.96]